MACLLITTVKMELIMRPKPRLQPPKERLTAMPPAPKEMLTAQRHLPNVQLPPQNERAEDLPILVMDHADLVPEDRVMDPDDLAMAPGLVPGDLDLMMAPRALVRDRVMALEMDLDLNLVLTMDTLEVMEMEEEMEMA